MKLEKKTVIYLENLSYSTHSLEWTNNVIQQAKKMSVQRYEALHLLFGIREGWKKRIGEIYTYIRAGI